MKDQNRIVSVSRPGRKIYYPSRRAGDVRKGGFYRHRPRDERDERDDYHGFRFDSPEERRRGVPGRTPDQDRSRRRFNSHINHRGEHIYRHFSIRSNDDEELRDRDTHPKRFNAHHFRSSDQSEPLPHRVENDHADLLSRPDVREERTVPAHPAETAHQLPAKNPAEKLPPIPVTGGYPFPPLPVPYPPYPPYPPPYDPYAMLNDEEFAELDRRESYEDRYGRDFYHYRGEEDED